MEKGRTGEALDAFRQSTRSDSACLPAWNDLAVLEASRGDLDAARATLEHALAIRSDVSVLIRNLEKVRSRQARLAYDSAFGTVTSLSPLALEWNKTLSAPREVAPSKPDTQSRALAAAREELRGLSGLLRDSLARKDAQIARLQGELDRLAAVAKPPASVPAAVVAAAEPPRKTIQPRVAAAPTPAPVPTPTPASATAPASSSVLSLVPVSDTIAALAHVAPESVSPSREGPLQSVLAWARAWSARDVDAYLAFYVSDFHPQDLDRPSWEAKRRERIMAPKSIRVDVQDQKLTMISSDHAEVVYRQVYQTEGSRLTSRKKIELTLVDGYWKILQEKEVR